MTPLFEHEAELAYQRQDQIEAAAVWCKDNYPHEFEFLNSIYLELVAESRQYIKLGLGESVRSGVVKLSPVLALLSPSQALRLLESYKRAVANDPKMWRTKKLIDLEQLDADRRCAATIAAIRKSREEQK